MTKKISLAQFGVMLAIFVGISYLLALWTERSAEFWLSYFKGDPVDVPLWLAWLLSLILNGVIFALNVISEVIRLVV